MSRARIGSLLVVLGAAAMVLAILLPWGTYNGANNASITFAGFETGVDFVITLSLAIVVGALGLWMYLGHVNRGRAIAAGLVGVLAAGWGAILFAAVKSVAGDYSVSFSYGLGLDLVLGGAFIAVAGSVWALVSGSSEPAARAAVGASA